MTSSRNAGGAKGSLRNTSRARGNSSAKGAKQQTSLSSSTVSAIFNALDLIPTSGNRTTGSPCGIKRLYGALPKELGDKVLTMIDTSQHTATDIGKILARFNDETGVRVSVWMVQKHRRRMKETGCSCIRVIGSV